MIRYALPEAGRVTLQVYDASGLSAGVYLYRIRAGSFTTI